MRDAAAKINSRMETAKERTGELEGQAKEKQQRKPKKKLKM